MKSYQDRIDALNTGGLLISNVWHEWYLLKPKTQKR